MGYPTTTEEFRAVVAEFQASGSYREPMLFAVGPRVVTGNGVIASVRYPVVNGPGQNTGTAAILMKVLGLRPEGVQSVVLTDEVLRKILPYFASFMFDVRCHGNIKVLQNALSLIGLPGGGDSVATFIFDDVPPVDVDDATLKLYGLSCRHFKPNTLNFDGIFKVLPNVTWVGDTPMDEEEVDAALMAAAFGGREFAPTAVDKFPLYLSRINADKMKVRITDQHKVRLGGYLGEETVLMPGASYVNYNAGTEKGIIEGRISSKAWVGAGSDIGGGASILGTLSGGNDVPISTGRNCLLEANSVLGIPIGDAVIVAAGDRVLAGSRVKVNVVGHPSNGKVVKAQELAGINGVTFRRNDILGGLEVVRTRRNEEFARRLADGQDILNADLHSNN